MEVFAIISRDQLTDEYDQVSLEDLVREEMEAQEYVDGFDWMNLTGGTAWRGELRYELENYAPMAHFHAVQELKAEEYAAQRHEEETRQFDGNLDADFLPDGSGEVYMWRHQDGIPYNHEHNGLVDPFFYSQDNAERAMERWVDEYDTDLSGAVLYRVHFDGHHKVMEYDEVVTEESGIGDFI